MSDFTDMFGSSSRGSRKVRGPYKEYKDEALKEKYAEVRATATEKTPMKWRQTNPKMTTSDAYYRYNKFMNAKTLGEYATAQKEVKTERDAGKHKIDPDPWGDIKDGLMRGFVQIG